MIVDVNLAHTYAYFGRLENLTLQKVWKSMRQQCDTQGTLLHLVFTVSDRSPNTCPQQL